MWNRAKHSRRAALIAFACVTTLLWTGCARSKSHQQSRLSENQAALTYGAGPKPDASVVYQPDVVIIQGGPRAIRSASADGLIWTIDGAARGARDLRPGKIMFATSRAVGRVMDIERKGDDLAVTLGPVRLTDVIRDALIKVDTEIRPESIVYQHVPGIPATVAQAMNFDRMPGGIQGPVPAALRMPGRYAEHGAEPLRLIDYRQEVPDPGLPFGKKKALKVVVGDWEIEPSLTAEMSNFDTESGFSKQSEKLGLKILKTMTNVKFGDEQDPQHSAGLKMGVNFCLFGRKFHLIAVVPISGGKIGQTKFVIEGIEGLDIGFWVGVANGVQDNQKARILEIPIELNYPVEAGGIPLVGQAKFKFIIETAFSGKNSVLEAIAKYAMSGPIGFDGDSVLSPTFEVIEPMTKNLKGITIGPSGIVFAAETRFLLGFGIPAAMAGPYAKLTVAFGATKGSSLGAFLATCTGVTVKMDMGYGVGVSISATQWALLEKILKKNGKLEFEVNEHSFPIVNRKSVHPDVPLCRIAEGEADSAGNNP